MENKVMRVEEKTIVDSVMNRVMELQENQQIMLPANYSVSNAMKAAYLCLEDLKTKDNRPVLEACTKPSIINALLEMAIKGLNVSKEQCYFIPYGNKLNLNVSYQGSRVQVKRLKGIKDVLGYPVYLQDEFELDFDITTGSQKLVKYKPNVKERTKDSLVGAFAIITSEEDDSILQVEYMSMEQVKAAWGMGQMNGNSKAHKQFPEEMAIKSVINRICKRYLNSSDDAEIFDALDEIANEHRYEEAIADANQETLAIEEEIEPVEVKEVEVVEEPEVIEPEESQQKEMKAPF